ncbi:DUF3048 domain-containing protein [Virgibacillus kekensis]|uniref:DUF3048 domain-containing protein n=1 Tax=Virgibacillus kekensis TaxID=202261 RepID=A0ABV9DPG5_9BACI
MLKKSLFYLLITLLTMILLAGCNGEEKTADTGKEKENAVEEKEQVETDADEASNVYPLTGVKTNKPVNDRIVGVMVNNHTKARPQTGLSKADIVFEILAEGQITRFLAMFQSQQPEIVGPVRSAREYYFELANGYEALYVYHGAAGFVNDMIKNRGIEHLNGSIYDNDGNLFKRETFRQAPHNSYLLFDAVYEVAKEKSYDVKHDYKPLPFLDKKEVGNISGKPANHVEIVYSDNPMEVVEFKYDEENGNYTRFNDREKTVELNSETPIQVENVFIVFTDHKVIDSAGRRAIDIKSGGDAYLIQNGKIQEVQWENREGRIIPVKDGQPVGFVPGQTWINIVPNEDKKSVNILN